MANRFQLSLTCTAPAAAGAAPLQATLRRSQGKGSRRSVRHRLATLMLPRSEPGSAQRNCMRRIPTGQVKTGCLSWSPEHEPSRPDCYSKELRSDCCISFNDLGTLVKATGEQSSPLVGNTQIDSEGTSQRCWVTALCHGPLLHGAHTRQQSMYKAIDNLVLLHRISQVYLMMSQHDNVDFADGLIWFQFWR